MTIWDDAKRKREERRDADCVVVPQLVTTLDASMRRALGSAANDTRNTFVLGHLASRNLYLAVGIPKNNRGALALELHVNLNAIEFLGRETNLHAEMAVVRHVCQTFNIDKSQLRGNLTIVCTGKGCCADCCGWMTRYRIDHGPTCNAEGSSQGWMHPLTGATFRGEKDEDFTYSKPSKYRTAATQMNPDPAKA